MRDPPADDVIEEFAGNTARRFVSTVELELAFDVVLARSERDRSIESGRSDAARGSARGPGDEVLRSEVRRAGNALRRRRDVPCDLAALRQRGHQCENAGTLALSGFEAQPVPEGSDRLAVRRFDVDPFADCCHTMEDAMTVGKTGGRRRRRAAR